MHFILIVTLYSSVFIFMSNIYVSFFLINLKNFLSNKKKQQKCN